MNRLLAFAALFTSIGTLFCCALPALFVILGAGASFAALTNAVPGLLLFGEYKAIVFLCGGVFLALGWVAYRRANPVICDIDSGDETACETTQKWVQPLLILASLMYLIGIGFAYVVPHFL